MKNIIKRITFLVGIFSLGASIVTAHAEEPFPFPAGSWVGSYSAPVCDTKFPSGQAVLTVVDPRFDRHTNNYYFGGNLKLSNASGGVIRGFEYYFQNEGGALDPDETMIGVDPLGYSTVLTPADHSQPTWVMVHNEVPSPDIISLKASSKLCSTIYITVYAPSSSQLR